MPSLHIREDLFERIILLGYLRRTEFNAFVHAAIEEKIRAEEERKALRLGKDKN